MAAAADGGADASGVLALVDAVDERGVTGRYLVPFVLDAPDGAARPAEPGDGVWRALAMAMAAGRVLGTDAGGALVCRPALALPAFAPGGAREIADWSERALGADQSNTSSVLGERLLLKAFRRLAPGLNPELEMAAFLAEERELPLVPALAGSAEYVGPDGAVVTVAVLQELVPDAEDAYESVAERLAGWITAPGVVALEFATEDAAELGASVARPPCDARRGPPSSRPSRSRPAEPRRPGRLAHRRPGPAARGRGASRRRARRRGRDRGWQPGIRDRLTALDPAATNGPDDAPLLIRIHGDLHLGQLLRTAGGFILVDFEGDPLRPIESDRRWPRRSATSPASCCPSTTCRGRRASRRSGRLASRRSRRTRRRILAPAVARAAPARLSRCAAAGRLSGGRGRGPARCADGRQGVCRVRVRGDVPARLAVGAGGRDAPADRRSSRRGEGVG